MEINDPYSLIKDPRLIAEAQAIANAVELPSPLADADMQAIVKAVRLSRSLADAVSDLLHIRSDAQEVPSDKPIPPVGAVAAPLGYSLDALGPVLGAAAAAIDECIKAPAAMCGSSVLAAASLAAQHLADVFILGAGTAPLSLYFMTSGASGERKTAVDKKALACHRTVEAEKMQARDAAYEQHLIELDIYDKTLAINIKKAGKRATAAGIREAYAITGEKPQAPPPAILIAGTPTIEGILDIYVNGAVSLGLFHNDAAAFIGGHSMASDKAMGTIGVLSTLWDDGSFDRIRRGTGEVGEARKFSDRRTAIHWMMQPIIIEKILSNELMVAPPETHHASHEHARKGALMKAICPYCGRDDATGKFKCFRCYLPLSPRDRPAADRHRPKTGTGCSMPSGTTRPRSPARRPRPT